MPDRPTEPTPPRTPRPKQGFSRYNIPSGEPRTLPPCGYVRVYSIAGTALALTFNDGDPVPVGVGDYFKADWPGVFEKIEAIATGGGAVLVVGYGASETSAGVTVSGSGAGIVVSASPEGSVTADPGALAYNTTDGGFWVKATGTGNTGWVQLIA